MGTYNGAKFLEEQLGSLDRQQVGHLDLIASDDGSTDDTVSILQGWRPRWQRGTVRIKAGPRQGFAENFRSLALDGELDADYVAFSDQDDVWDTDKLSAAIAKLSADGPERPALYLSRTRLVDQTGKEIGRSPLFRRPPSFANALVQSIGGANTVVMNRGGFALFRASIQRTAFAAHDWWSYLIISGAGGSVHYDPVAHISYRQHGDNLVGTNIGLRAALRRFVFLARGGFSDWIDANVAGLETCQDLLTDEARKTLEQFKVLRRSPPLRALGMLAKGGYHRQTLVGDVGLWAAVVLRGL